MADLFHVLRIYGAAVLIWLIVASFSLVSVLRKDDMRRWEKISWCAVIITLPLVGLAVYLVYRQRKDERV